MSENPGWVETKEEEEVEEGGGYLVNCVEAEQIRADHRILSAFKHSADNQKSGQRLFSQIKRRLVLQRFGIAAF